MQRTDAAITRLRKTINYANELTKATSESTFLSNAPDFRKEY
jgi:hypothetical protein